MSASAEAIEDVYHRRYGGFRRGAAGLAGDFDLADDAVQDGFATALARRKQFRGGSLEAWVWAIIARKAIDLRRRHRRILDDDYFEPAVITSERDPHLAEAIRALPPRRRLVVFLRYFADLPYAAIAETCGIEEGTVAATLAEAHAELREALELEGVGR